jgi:hypothetical protein
MGGLKARTGLAVNRWIIFKTQTGVLRMNAHFSFSKTALVLACAGGLLLGTINSAQAQSRNAKTFRCDASDSQNASSDLNARYSSRQQAQAACAGRVLPYFTAKSPAQAKAKDKAAKKSKASKTKQPRSSAKR